MAGLRIRDTGGAVVVGIARDLPIPMRGAALLAILAAPPKRTDDPHTLLAYRRWCRYLAHTAGQEGGDWMHRPQLAAPADLISPLDAALRALPRMLKNAERRLGAAHAAARFLQAAGTPARGRAREHGKRLRIEGEIVRASADEDARREALAALGMAPIPSLPPDPDNFETRVLRPSLPVLHLAFAYAQAMGEVERYLEGRPKGVQRQHGLVLPGAEGRVVYLGGLGDLLTNGAFQERLLDRAGGLEALLERMPKLRPDKVVRVALEKIDLLAPASVRFVPLVRTRPPAAAENDITIHLPADVPGEQVAITLLATLAWPPRSAEDPHWDERVAAFNRVVWHRRLEATPALAERLQPATPAHLAMPLPRALQLVGESEEAIRKRLLAAGALGPSVQALAGGRMVSSQGPEGRWSLAGEIRRFLAADPQTAIRPQARDSGPEPGPLATGGDGTAVKNFETRVIGTARPVLHLAVAFAFMLQQMEHEQGGGTGPRVSRWGSPACAT